LREQPETADREQPKGEAQSRSECARKRMRGDASSWERARSAVQICPSRPIRSPILRRFHCANNPKLPTASSPRV